MRFYLGLPQPGWLARAGVPAFVSAAALRGRKTVPHAPAAWALDSGGYNEIRKNGRWTVEPSRYAEDARGWARQAGMPDFAACQDWTCDPGSLAATGSGVREHQERTLASLLALRAADPGMPWMPVLQGWTWDDYMRHAQDHEDAGIALAAEPVVGLGSVAARQDSPLVSELTRALHARGVRLHGFGIKGLGLARCSAWLASSDSMSWSAEARWGKKRMDGCAHANCANCLKWALAWRERTLEAAVAGERAGAAVESQGLLF